MDPIQQSPNLPPVPQPNSPSFPKTTLVLTGVIVLLLALLGFSFSQVLSLKQQVDNLKTAAKPEPTPLVTPIATPVSPGTSTGTITPAPTGSTNGPIEITGIIKFSDLEGGCWSIEPTQAKCSGDRCPLSELPNYEIINIPAALKKDGIKATFKLEVLPDTATTCQLGPAVKILDYQIIK